MKRAQISAWFLGIFALSTATNVNASDKGELHVPSPDWRDQIVYFLMIDRFNNGDPSNDDQGIGEFNPGQNASFSGGDLPGIENKINYIKNLGATAVWVTPPVANQWWSISSNYGGYHGYWAENLMAVDKHFGTLQDYQSLSKALHAQDMYLIQDIVVNHMGNYFSYPQGWNKDNPADFFHLEPATPQGGKPGQFPFSQNDARDPAQRAAGIYHWTPDIVDYADPEQVHNYQMAGLDDLNTENPVVRDALRRSYAFWIKEAGVDGFRVDTAFYVPPDYFRDFLYSPDAANPGMFSVAAQTGRSRFHVFGEGFAVDKPYEEGQSRRIAGYIRDAGGQPLMPGMLNFPLYGTSADVFARGHATAELGHRIDSMMRLYPEPHLMPSFVDNHDVDRFLVNGDLDGLKQNLLLIMTLPGIPVIYYGTEQGLQEQRAAMFKAGFGSMGRDRFDEQSELYRYIRSVSGLRRQNKLFSRGTPVVLKDNPAGAGVLAYRMQQGDSQALVLFNSAGHEALLDNLDTGLPEGSTLQPLFSIKQWNTPITVGGNGRLSLALPARSGLVLVAGKQTTAKSAGLASLHITPLPATEVTDDFTVSGTASHIDQLQVVVDGDLQHAITVVPDGTGRWQSRISTQAMMDPGISHSVVAWAAAHGLASEAVRFTARKPWRTVVELADPKGDDHGPTGSYRYPADDGWGRHRQLDIERVTVATAGNALAIRLKMHSVTQLWNPANGFDHVAFTAFLELPGKSGGSTLMPLQNATLPAGMRWHYRLRAHGWSNALFSADGAGKDHEGTPGSDVARISVDGADNTVQFILPGKALGNPESLSGAKLYITTWDYDGGYRSIAPVAENMRFGGGNPDSPKIMDATAVIVLP
jgi:glycosidase/carbohydrate-binding DOMON domain-containing protein